MSETQNNNAGKAPAVFMTVTAAVWILSLAAAVNMRSKTEALTRKHAENLRLSEQLASAHDAVKTHTDFIARNGNVKNGVRQKWGAIDGASLARAIDAAGAESPPSRLESVTITKTPGTADTLAADAFFTSYSHR